MFSIQVLYSALERVRKCPEFQTNCFFLHPKLAALSQLEEAQIRISDGFVVLTYPERNFQRLYFWTANCQTIPAICRAAQDLLESDVMVMDLVGKAAVVQRGARYFEAQGMERYALLSRYQATELHTVPEKAVRCTCSLVPAADVEKILPLLEEKLDPYVSHLPTVSYLYELQKQGLLYGCYIDRELVGVVCLESRGKWGCYVYQIAITKKEQRKGLFTILQNYVISHNRECRHWSIWIDDTNAGSIRGNEKTGMKKDGMQEMVFLLWNHRSL